MISPQDINFIIIIISSFILSIFFSSSETIFSTVNRFKIKVQIKKGKTTAKISENLVKTPEKFLTPILVGNNIANILYSSSIAFFCINTEIHFFHNLSLIAQTIYQTIILLLFAEIIPKIFAKNNADNLVYFWIYPFKVIEFILKPFSYTFMFLSRIILHIIGKPISSDDKGIFSRFELEGILEEAVQKDNNLKKNANVINNIMNLRDTKVKEIMTPRNQLFALDKEASIYELKKIIRRTSYSKIPIYDKFVDRIIGVIFAHDLVYKPEKCVDIIKKVKFVPSNITVYNLFLSLKKEKLSIAIILDEFGGTIGIATMHDIWENILGEIGDLDDKNNFGKSRGLTYRDQKNMIIADCSVDIDDFNNFLENIVQNDKYKIIEENFDTLNGFIINHLERIPKKNEFFTYNELEYKIMKAHKNKIETVTIQLP